MVEERKTPRIRFPGFTNDWEQRKLESLCDVFTDGDWIEVKDQSDLGIRLVQTGNIGTTEYLDKENNKKWISEETFERLRCKEIYEGDILISRLPEPAGRACIIPDLGTRMITAVDCTIVRPSKEYDSKYLVQYLSTPMYFKVVNSFLGGGTRQRISRGNLSGIDIPIPSTIEEQRKIGECLSNLDNLITLHQRKCDDLKKMKHSMLQKMFPKEGESIPEIRFSEFTGAWEQRKLGEIYSERNERGNKALQILTVSIHSGISDGELEENNLGKHVRRSEDKTKYKRVYPGDLVFNMMRAWQGAIGVAKCDGMVSPAYISAIPNEAVYPLFMDYLLRRKETIDEINDLSYGVTDFRKRLYWNSFVKVNCLIPCIDEQKKIYEFFTSLDTLIRISQGKNTKLKELKKGLLQQMMA